MSVLRVRVYFIFFCEKYILKTMIYKMVEAVIQYIEEGNINCQFPLGNFSEEYLDLPCIMDKI